MQLVNEVPNLEQLLEKNPQLKAVFWDLDGTILLTEILHANAYKQIIESSAETSQLKLINLEELEEKCMGQTDPVIFKQVQELGLLKGFNEVEFLLHKNQVMKDQLPQVDIHSILHVDIKNLIVSLHQNGIKQAVVTSSEKQTAYDLISHVGLTEYFEFILTREDTNENKPSPVPYQKAMELMQITPQECIIFEDSEVGQAAATASQGSLVPARWYY